MRKYRMDCVTNTLIISQAFQTAAATYNSEEYNLILALKRDIPDLKVIVAAPTHHKRSKKTSITTKTIRRYLSAMRDSDVRIKVLDSVIAASKPQEHPIKYIRDWFVTEYPHYSEKPQFDTEGYLLPSGGTV